MSEVTQPITELTLPAKHLEARLVAANETYMLAARGTWKTSRGLALYFIDVIYDMPRHTSVLTGISFEHLGDNTLPPLLQAWEEFGFSHGDHYVIGRRPPKDWPKPYLGIINEKYDHVISWHNGTCIPMISLAKKASANGISAQSGGFDEVKFMDPKQLQDEIFPVFRGNEKYFRSSSLYMSKFFATDKLADPARIKWLLNKRDLVDEKKKRVVLSLALELSKLKQAYNSGGKTIKQQLKPQIHAIEVRLAKLRANMVNVVEIGAQDVVYAYGERWLKDKERNLSKHAMDVSILNKDPDKPGDAFYPAFDEGLHTHVKEYDINPTKPFVIAADYQHSIAPIAVAQYCTLPGAEQASLNYVDEVYTLANPIKEAQENGNGKMGGLTAAVQMFCDRYKSHLNKTVYYVYDQTAIGGRGEDDRHCDKVINTLRRNGWSVVELYTGQPPLHSIKYNDADDWLTGKDPNCPAIRINRRCKKMIISITGSPVVTKNGRTQKDKSSELEASLDQSETTHFSDTFDMINHAVLKLRQVPHTIEIKRASLR